MSQGLERMYNKSRVEFIEAEAKGKFPEMELTYKTAAGRKNMHILEELFKEKSPKRKYPRELSS